MSRTDDARPVAFVTGASRGIGKAVAVSLAKAGYDVALGARTLHDGERREHSSTIAQSDTSPLPGSLDETAALVASLGVDALSISLDLLDRASLAHGVENVLETWGRIDVLVNNARYVGPGHMDRLLATPIDLIDVQLQANVIGPILLTQLVLPQMLERGNGVIINMASTSGKIDPPKAAGEGGWGLGYGASKGALHRLAGIVAVEHGSQGIRAYNLSPGFIATERIAQDMGSFGFDAAVGAPAEVVGEVARWLVCDPAAVERNGQWIEAQPLCKELGLVAGWPPPKQ